MADVKISELTALTSPDGAEELVVNDGGTTKKITITNATSASLPKAGGTMTGVIAGFESTGIDDNATSTAVTIDASENVGIGTSSPDSKLEVEGSTAGTYIRVKGTVADGYRHGYELENTHTGGRTWSMFTTNNSDGVFGGGKLVFSNVGADSATAANSPLIINDSGNVGIGVVPEYWNSTYRQALQIGHSVSLSAHKSTNILVLANNAYYDGNNTRWEYINSGEEAAQIEMTAAGAINFDVAPSGSADAAISWNTAMTIDNSSKVMIRSTGTTAEGWNFNGTGFLQHCTPSGSARSMTGFYNGGNVVGEIRTSTTATAYLTSSDYRLKENVTSMSGATAAVKLLKPCNFDWIRGGNVNGFLAHEVAEVVPEAVSGTKDAMMDEEYEVSAATGDVFTPSIDSYVDDDENEVEAVAEVIHSADVEQPETLEEGQQWRETTAQVMGTRSVPDMQGIDQAKLVPLLTATIQELIARIEALEAT